MHHFSFPRGVFSMRSLALLSIIVWYCIFEVASIPPCAKAHTWSIMYPGLPCGYPCFVAKRWATLMFLQVEAFTSGIARARADNRNSRAISLQMSAGFIICLFL